MSYIVDILNIVNGIYGYIYIFIFLMFKVFCFVFGVEDIIVRKFDGNCYFYRI